MRWTPLLAALAFAMAALAGVAGCKRKRPDAKTLPDVLSVQGFERGLYVKRWPRDGNGKAEPSGDWSAEGKRSLMIGPGMMASFTDLEVDDWTGYGVLRFTVHNPSPRTAPLGLEIQDEHDDHYDRHQHSFGALPGDHVIELDFSGGLWRGEENRPYRGSVKTPIDIAKITRLAFTNGGSSAIFVDRVEIVKVPDLRTRGGFAFDFGPRGSQVMSQMTGVFEDTRYDPSRGYGFLGPTGITIRPMSYPTPLLGDGLAFESTIADKRPGEPGKPPTPDPGFRVDLPGGPYLGWIAFERGGFTEGEQATYRHADVLVNGKAVTGHDFPRGGPHFLFEDTEVTDLSRIEDDLVRPAHAITRLRFEAQAGENIIHIKQLAPGPNPLRVAGLVLAPDTPEGKAFLDAHEERQRAAMKMAFPPQDRGRREHRREPADVLVAEPLPLGAELYPRDWPVHAEGMDPPEIVAVTGQVAALQLALHARVDVDAKVEVEPLQAPSGATLAGVTISHGRYLPTRPLGNGPVWLQISHYRRGSSFRVGPALARALLVEIQVAEDAPPGLYTGAIVVKGPSNERRIPLRARVHALKLPPVPIPVGLFMNALPFGPEAVGEDRFWELSAALLDEQARAGLNCVTGGKGLDLRVRRAQGGRAVTGERALFYLALAKTRGPLLGIVNYGGFFPREPIRPADGPVFARALATFAAERRLPPFYFATYDEPGTPAEIDASRATVEPLTRAGLRTMGFLTRHEGDSGLEALVAATYAPVLGSHEPGSLRALAARGMHPWVYNNGMSRWAMGIQLWRNIRAGAEGRLEWIGLITQGFAFDDLDGREPANASFLVHDRLGPMPTPKWLAAREGLLDLRIRLALEQKVGEGDPALRSWIEDGYGKDQGAWTPAALDAARRAMLERLAR
jgi:hypothetical protein